MKIKSSTELYQLGQAINKRQQLEAEFRNKNENNTANAAYLNDANLQMSSTNIPNEYTENNCEEFTYPKITSKRRLTETATSNTSSSNKQSKLDLQNRFQIFENSNDNAKENKAKSNNINEQKEKKMPPIIVTGKIKDFIYIQ